MFYCHWAQERIQMFHSNAVFVNPGLNEWKTTYTLWWCSNQASLGLEVLSLGISDSMAIVYFLTGG